MAFYRITPEEQQAIDKFQAGHPVFNVLLGRRLGTDHNHKTGLIRGRLDFRINQAYGRIENAFPHNTAAVLRALADFHESPPATTVLGAPRYGLLGKAKYKRKMVYGPLEII